MARYIMANRRAGKFTDSEKLASRESIQLLQQTCQSIGLDSSFQGRGMPQI